ncbi:MAG: cardiolipin synthase, partial [Longimicrobiales bacterium]
MVALAVVAFQVLGLVSSIHAVMTARTSQGSIAWAVVLNTFPYLAVPAYWIFGRSQFQGYVTARRTDMLGLASSEAEAVDRLSELLLTAEETPPAARAAERLAALPFLHQNAVDLLIDGEETFASILAGIDRARDYILFQFFVVKDDELGREVQSRLMAKAREGVRVYFLYDEVGSHRLPARYKNELREAGVQVHNFHTRQGPWNRFQINFRNHRKVVVVDGGEAWIGGHNVGDEYMGRDPKFGRWRDTHVRIEGPAALAAQLSFIEDWHWATADTPEVSWTPKEAADGSDIPVLIVPTGPADEIETAALMFIHAINTAQERIWIASPYFVPDEAVIAALQLAGLRGVDVRILIPDRPDHLLVYLAAFSYFDDARRTGVEFFRYTDGFLHQKTMLIDDRAAGIGTANFDNRSFRLNFEITAIVGSPGFVSQVEEMFEADFARSRRVEDGEYRDRPFWFKLGVRLARLTSPV